MKLPANTPWLIDPKAQKMCAVIENGGFEIFFVGGCVRNAVMNVEISDIDLSTNARPEIVMKLARDAGLKAIPTGVEHGTVTVVVEGEPFEITTFRRDVETDGRRAVVTFSDSIEDDARRRDFTMNALYAKPNGTVVDPLNGLQDAVQRRVRFIEDAGARIREDYLRTLRFFRFVAWYSAPEDGFDPSALDAIATNLEGLNRLSAERVGSEILKLLAAPDPAPAVAAMRQTGVLIHVLPGADDKGLAPLIHFEKEMSLDPDPCLRLAALGGQDASARLRLSKADARRVKAYLEAASGTETAKILGHFHGVNVALGSLALRSALLEMPIDPSARAAAEQGEKAVFPITSADLKPEFEGKALGDKLKELKADWIASGFRKSKDDLLG